MNNKINKFVTEFCIQIAKFNLFAEFVANNYVLNELTWRRVARKLLLDKLPSDPLFGFKL